MSDDRQPASAPDQGDKEKEQRLPLALAATRPGLARPLADLMWTALNTPLSNGLAVDPVARLLRSVVRRDGTEWTRPGLAVLLPALAAGENNRRRLNWLLPRLLDGPENPVPETLARDLWQLAVTPQDGTTDGEKSHA